MDSITYSAAVAKKVAAAIESSELTFAEVAAQAHIPRSTLDRRLSGMSDLTVREVKALADVLGTTAAELTTIAAEVVAA